MGEFILKELLKNKDINKLLFMKKLLIFLLLSTFQLHAQISPCDSVRFNIDPVMGGDLILDANISSVLQYSAASLEWTACDEYSCYYGSGPFAIFGQFDIEDTLKVCLIAEVDYMGSTHSCQTCDSLVYETNTGWIVMDSETTLSITELFNGNVKIFPNPTNGNLTIDLGADANDYKVTLKNSFGQIISFTEQPLNNIIHLNIDEPSGIYILEIVYNDAVYTKKIIKQ